MLLRMFGTTASNLPSFHIDCMTGVLDSRLTFARASNAWYINSSGVLTSASTNNPRFDYNPSTLALNGLLIEEQRTNLILQSQFTSSWPTSAATLTANQISSNFGNTATLIQDTTNNIHRAYSINSVTASTQYTFSVYAKDAGQTYMYVNGGLIGAFATFNLVTGTVAAVSAGTAAIKPLGGGWYRCSVTGTAPTTQAQAIFIQLNNSGVATDTTYIGNGTSGLQINNAQLEAGAFPTSAILTTGSAVTRAADSVYTTSLSWFNAAAGTFEVEHFMPYAPANNSYPGVASFSDGTSGNLIAAYVNGQRGLIGFFSRTGGATRYDTGNSGGSTYTAGTITKQALAYSASNTTAYANSLQQISGTYPLPTITRLDLGSDPGGTPLNGWLRKFNYWNTALPSMRLQATTT